MPCLPLPCSSADPNPNPNPDLPDPFAPLLRDSAGRFIAGYRDAATDFSCFSSIFSRLIHGLRDPPVEAVWFYSAVTFHQTKLAAAPRGRVAAVKDLFQLLVSCSASGGPVKRIAVLAPAVYELCGLASEKEQLEREEVRSLVEGLVSYVSICCAEVRDGEDDGDQWLSSCFSDVVRVWMVDRLGVGDDFKEFFPIAGDAVRTGMSTEERCRIGHLAGIVMCEVFLLRLCLRLGLEISRPELEKDVQNCAAQMITGAFRRLLFYETLLKIMLEPGLPVANFLTSKDECFLREVLYDSVIMAGDSFFKSQLETLLPSERLKNLAVMWLLVANNAICFTRKYGDQSKVMTYMSVFSESCLVSHLIQWITNLMGMEGKIAPNVSTPLALIKWMLLVEDQGARVFDCEFSKMRARGITCSSRFDRVLPMAQPDDCDLEMVDLEDTPTTDGIVTRIDGQRKRKGSISESEIQAKFVKYQVCEKSLGLSCASEMGNPVSDREMVDMHQ